MSTQPTFSQTPTVAVLGAGVMGAQIAAHLANAHCTVYLFDLCDETAQGAARNKRIQAALAGLKKLQPTPITTGATIARIKAANFTDDLQRLSECDLVIEAVVETLDIKKNLYQKISPHLGARTILATNTSGLPLNTLVQYLPAAIQPRFCGMHFFNPPRYMPLVELIPTTKTPAALLDSLESWLTQDLGKRVLRAKDTPNFIANRVGVFALLAVIHHGMRLKLPLDQVDLLSGTLIGRAKSATYRTADVVGLDTLGHVIKTMALPQDPWHSYFVLPDWLQALIAKGHIGQKSGAGIYQKQGKTISVWNPHDQTYGPMQASVTPALQEILALKNPAQRWQALQKSQLPEAQFIWSISRDVWHYAAYHLAEIADSTRDIDLALRDGFGWRDGPFELWQQADWSTMRALLADDIAKGRAMTSAALPAWVQKIDAAHTPNGSFAPAAKKYLARSALPVYNRQLYPVKLIGEATPTMGTTRWNHSAVRLWSHPIDDGVAILSLTAKVHAMGEAALEGMLEGIARAEREAVALVMWSPAPFCVGANLKEVLAAAQAKEWTRLENTLRMFQQASCALKYASIPTIAAVEGMALGGGAEFVMHAQHRVLALESVIGLVEAAVGLIPAGGGSAEWALRAHAWSQQADGMDAMPFIQKVFNGIARADTAKNAFAAQQMGYATQHDHICFQAADVLYVALRQARALAHIGHRPLLAPASIPVLGKAGIANLEMGLANLRAGRFISDYDYRVARAAAVALCGGEIDANSVVDLQWLLAVERQEFMALLAEPLTQARMAHMMTQGKALRN